MSLQLWYAPTSPFARKVRVAAFELGVALDLVEVDPWTDDRLRALNPLAKVPTLVLPDGEVVWESGLIVERLDGMMGGRLFPDPGPNRWKALALQGLADGASAAAGRLFAEQRKPPDQRSEMLSERFRQALNASLDRLESEDFPDSPTVGEITVACFLGYLDFRWPGQSWSDKRPRLAAWYREFATRPSMRSTEHRVLEPR